MNDACPITKITRRRSGLLIDFDEAARAVDLGEGPPGEARVVFDHDRKPGCACIVENQKRLLAKNQRRVGEILGEVAFAAVILQETNIGVDAGNGAGGGFVERILGESGRAL